MSKLIACIYIPGLGDDKTHGQDTAITSWNKYGINAHYFAVGWSHNQSFTASLDKLCELINSLHKQHGRVALVGASAGASAVINAVAILPKKISCIVSICGKINNPDFNHRAFKSNPAFIESMKMLPDSIKAISSQSIPVLSINSLYDRRVPLKDTLIPGAKVTTLPIPGHVLAIAYAVSFGKKTITTFISSPK